MIIVADSSPLIGLARVGRLELWRSMLGPVPVNGTVGSVSSGGVTLRGAGSLLALRNGGPR